MDAVFIFSLSHSIPTRLINTRKIVHAITKLKNKPIKVLSLHPLLEQNGEIEQKRVLSTDQQVERRTE